MSKAQRIIIALTLLIIALFLLFPRTYTYVGDVIYAHTEFIFTKNNYTTIDLQGTIYKSLAAILAGAIVVILLGLKKESGNGK